MNDSFDVIKASDLAIKTSNAYMHDLYGRENWIQCILFLLAEGLDEDQIESIVRSKHMRWSWQEIPFEIVKDFKRYYAENRNNILAM